MLKKFRMDDARTAPTLLESSLPLRKATKAEKRANQLHYQEITGSLNHLAVYSRPDIAFAVSKLSQFNSDPTETHLKAARHVLRYLKGTADYSIIYGGGGLEIHGYADADWGSDKDDRKSTTGYVFTINNGPVSWTSHKQSSTAVSTMGAEYMALSDAAREAIAHIHLYDDLRDLYALKNSPPLLLSDSQSALALTGTVSNYPRSKHIDIRYHFIRDVIQKGLLTVDYIPTTEQPADILTKALGLCLHHSCIQRLRLNLTAVTAPNTTPSTF